MKKGIIFTAIYIFILAFVFVFILAAVNELTKDQIAKNGIVSLRKGVLAAFGVPFASDDEAFSKYESLVVVESREGNDLFVYKSKDDTYYAAIFQGNGLWGIIRLVLAVDSSVTHIIGLQVISHIETAGLGGRIDEPAYKAQFSGEKIGDDGKIKLTRQGTFDTNHDNGSIDGITGATRTSESMRNITNDGIVQLKRFIGEKK